MATKQPKLAVGAAAPDFALTDDRGNPVRLKDFRGRRVVVYFYPAALTPGCTKQACDFRDSLEALDRAGIDVIGISPDKPEKLARFRKEHKLNFPLLSDPEREVQSAYGAYGKKMMYGKEVTGVIRSTFVVDPKGKLEYVGYGVKATGHVDKLKRDLEL